MGVAATLPELSEWTLPMTNIRKEPSGGGMIVLFMVMSFVFCYWMCRSYVSVISFRICLC